jgi:GTP pyrophosphokinase
MTHTKAPRYAFLTQAENRDTFFERVHRFILPYHDDALLVDKAYKTAKEAFRGVKRKRGERYFEHCRSVALIGMDLLGIRDPEVIAALLLHDIVEDCSTEWPIERVEREFGQRTAALVAALSMPTGVFASRDERQHAYHAQLLAGPPETFAGKLADRLHNLLSCEALTPEAQWRMIEETERSYLSIAKERGILFKELKLAIAARRKALGTNVKAKA